MSARKAKAEARRLDCERAQTYADEEDPRRGRRRRRTSCVSIHPAGIHVRTRTPVPPTLAAAPSLRTKRQIDGASQTGLSGSAPVHNPAALSRLPVWREADRRRKKESQVHREDRKTDTRPGNTSAIERERLMRKEVNPRSRADS